MQELNKQASLIKITSLMQSYQGIEDTEFGSLLIILETY